MAVSDLLVRAAGGVLVRTDEGPQPVVLMVHRPSYDDWTFPKGKADGDELDEDTALREVEEETGFACTLGPEITTTHYVDRRGRPKRVRWYSMTVIEDRGFTATDEVDERRWVPISEAPALLTYARDQDILDHLGKLGES
ncbi:MAG TPA: NUDIX hydrolase [Acidimicrobiia bacterium]